MKTYIFLLSFLIIHFFTGCEEKVIHYEGDPRLYNDAFHGHIVGKVLQHESRARVIINQEVPVDSTDINPEDGTFRIENIEIGNYDLEIKAENYRTYSHANVKVEGAGTTYIGEIDLSTVPDLVSYYYPEDLAEIVYNNRFARLSISVTFTRPMDRESVEAAFSTEPESEGMFFWGQFTTEPRWYYFVEDRNSYAGFDPEATITTYSKISSFTYSMAQKDSYVDTTYHVTLSTAAQDTAGNTLRFPLEFSFSTIQSSSTLNGIQTNPYHGDVDVDLINHNGIQMIFPRNMDQPSTERAISIEPEGEVIFIWPDYNELTIYTGGVFRAETVYEIEVDETAKDLDGNLMQHPFSFSFTTAPVGIRSSYPRNGELFVDLDQAITMYFNTYILKSSVENAFQIIPYIPGTFKWGTRSSNSDDKSVITFIPSREFTINTKYTVILAQGVRDMFGTYMKDPYSFAFITRPE
jgi:hypothetical protein